MATNKQGNLLISNESTLVERIYFNTELTIEEVVEILSKLTLTNNGYYAFLTSDYSSTLSLLGNHTLQEYVLFGIDGGSPAPIFATSVELAADIGVTIDWTGWNPNLVNPMEINSYGVAEIEGYSIGTQNDLLTNLISMNTDFALPEPITNLPEFLTGIADAIREVKGKTEKINAQNFKPEIRSISANFTIYENTKFGKVIPNFGTVEYFYLNVAMEPKDIHDLLNNLPSDAWTEISDELGSVYFIANVNVSGIQNLPLVIFKVIVSGYPSYIVVGLNGGELTTLLSVTQSNNTTYEKSFIEGVTEDTNLIELLKLNNYTLELLDTFVGSDSDGILAGISAPVGQYNNLLIKLIAITKFLDGKLTIGKLEGGEYLAKELTIDNETIDVLEIMSNKEIPIKVSNVNLLQKIIDSNETIDYLFKGFNTKEGYLYKNLNLNDIHSMQYAFFGNGDDDSVFPYLTIPYEKIFNANNAFNSCSALIGEVTMDLLVLSDAQRMFEYASNLESITFPNGTPKLTFANNMFGNCTSLTTIKGLDLGNLNSAAPIFASGVTNATYSYRLPLLANLDIKNIKYGFRIVEYDIDRSELTVESLVGLCKECIKQSTQQTLSIGNINLTKLADVYVKFTDSTITEIAEGEKGEVEVCESTDEGAMTIQEYMALKSWRYAG